MFSNQHGSLQEQQKSDKSDAGSKTVGEVNASQDSGDPPAGFLGRSATSTSVL